MATTARALSPHPVDLGTDAYGQPLRGVRQPDAALNGHGLWFAAAVQYAEQSRVDDLAVYLIEGGAPRRYVLAGWMGEEVVRSEPFAVVNDPAVTQFVNQINDVHNRRRLDLERKA